MLPQDYTQGQFNPSKGSGKVLIPVGTYRAMAVINSDLKETSSGGYMLVITVVITEGEHQGVELIDRLNLVNANADAARIAGRRLDSICAAVGLSTRPADTSAIHGKHMLIETKNVKSKDWVDDNGVTREGTEGTEIKAYLPLPASSSGFKGTPVKQQVVQAATTSTDSSPF